MRLIRKALLLAIVAGGGVVAVNTWSDGDWTIDATSRNAERLATRAAVKAGRTMSESAITAKIKSKMALDEHVNARAIDVDTSGSVVELSGVVASARERVRAVDLARDTEGVSRVVDRLRIGRP
jgi:hyperosmotically inducible protein